MYSFFFSATESSDRARKKGGRGPRVMDGGSSRRGRAGEAGML